MSNVRIPRPDKDRMRDQLEELLRMQNALLGKIEAFSLQTEVADYCAFWGELKTNHNELNHKISRYMVKKCNR